MDCKELTYQIIDGIYKVYNSLMPSLNTEIYHQLLSEEFNLREIPFIEKKGFLITNTLGIAETYTPNFIIDERIVIDINSSLVSLSESPIYSTIKKGMYKLGLLVNFSQKGVHIQHILCNNYKERSCNYA